MVIKPEPEQMNSVYEWWNGTFQIALMNQIFDYKRGGNM